MDKNEIEEKLSQLDGWELADNSICKKFKFKNFVQSLDFVNKIGAQAEEANHHPDIEFGWGYANITFTTHDAGGLREGDFKAAARVETI